jgi:polysaccharide biosynthesis PFTS motif protein
VNIGSDIPPVPSYSKLATFVLWGLSASILSFARMLTGRWWDALLLTEAAKAKLIKLSPNRRLAREYFFLFDWAYRPIWTYVAESKGSKLFFVFYSTNSEQFKTINGYIPLLFDWRSINWPNYIVWDDYQANFIRRHSRFDARFYIAGPIHLSGKVSSEVNIKERSIAVFDVMPMRSSVYATLGLYREYLVPETCRGFVEDICKSALELDFHVYLKTKRMVSRRIHPTYRNLLKSILQFPNVTVLEGDYPAEALIKKTQASISMPWTSTALIANFFSKPCCYYDSTGTLMHDDRGAHGVEVCVGKHELLIYLKKHLAEL